MMMKIDFIDLLVNITLGLFTLFMIGSPIIRKHELNRDGVVVYGQIEGGKADMDIVYSFEFRGALYYGSFSPTLLRSRDYCSLSSVAVLCLPDMPEKNVLLTDSFSADKLSKSEARCQLIDVFIHATAEKKSIMTYCKEGLDGS